MPLSKLLIVGFSQNGAAEGSDGALAVLEIGAGEHLAGGGQDAHPGVLLVAEPIPGRVQFCAARR